MISIIDKSDVCVICKQYGESYDPPTAWSIKTEVNGIFSSGTFLEITVLGFCNVHSDEWSVQVRKPPWEDLPSWKLAQFQAFVVMFQ
jgi:hypothetical protein